MASFKIEIDLYQKESKNIITYSKVLVDNQHVPMIVENWEEAVQVAKTLRDSLNELHKGLYTFSIQAIRKVPIK